MITSFLETRDGFGDIEFGNKVFHIGRRRLLKSGIKRLVPGYNEKGVFCADFDEDMHNVCFAGDTINKMATFFAGLRLIPIKYGCEPDLMCLRITAEVLSFSKNWALAVAEKGEFPNMGMHEIYTPYYYVFRRPVERIVTFDSDKPVPLLDVLDIHNTPLTGQQREQLTSEAEDYYERARKDPDIWPHDVFSKKLAMHFYIESKKAELSVRETFICYLRKPNKI